MPADDSTRKSSMGRKRSQKNDGFQRLISAPCQLRTLAGQEHDRTIPLPDKSLDTEIAFRLSAAPARELERDKPREQSCRIELADDGL